MELLQWHEVCELGGDKLHRPPVVALNSVATKETRDKEGSFALLELDNTSSCTYRQSSCLFMFSVILRTEISFLSMLSAT